VEERLPWEQEAVRSVRTIPTSAGFESLLPTPGFLAQMVERLTETEQAGDSSAPEATTHPLAATVLLAAARSP
jgi:hypothetical protein